MQRKGDGRRSTKAILLVYFIFFGSGVCGLIYEVVWLRMLTRIMGVTIYATSTVVAAFMAGLALGSFLLGRFIDKREDPLRVYATLELLIGGTALLVPIIFSLSLPLYKYVYAASGENQLLITVLRTLICFFALLLPTTLMGGTLPVLTSWLVKRGILFGKSFSLLYGINTLGAVFGVFISGFITLEILGEYKTILLGVFLNFLVAGLAYTIYKKEVPTEDGPVFSEALPGQMLRKISPYSDKVRRVVLLAFIISGFTSLAYEVIWTRQLILFLQTSIYAFSGMLVVFLAGIALGSLFMRDMADRFVRPIVVFGILELVIGFLSVGNLYLFPVFDGYSLGTMSGRLSVLAATVIIVFPLTFVFGMIFPTASVCYAKDVSETGASVGWLYSANTIGSIFGALLAGFWLIPVWGSTNAVVLMALLNVGLGFLLLWMDSRGSMRTKICYLTVIPILFLLIFQVKVKDPFLSTIAMRIQKIQQINCKEKDCTFEIFYNKEGIEGTVTAFSINNQKSLWINGIGMTTLCTETKLMSHLPIIYTTKPAKEMLIICFGMGTVLKSGILYPDLNITTVELVPEEYKTFGYYHKNAEEILKRKNVHTLVNDGRNYILLSPNRYDIITVDPAPPLYSAGTVNLYTREFFQICKERLTPEGVMCLWVPGGRETEVKSLIRTFHSVFPNMRVYIGPHKWGFYFIGTMKEISESDVRHNMEKAFGNPAIIRDLSEYDNSCITSQQLNQMFLWDNNEIKSIAADGVLITDDYPYTEFFLWRYLIKREPNYQPLPLMKANN
jgi:spermidine synthase